MKRTIAFCLIMSLLVLIFWGPFGNNLVIEISEVSSKEIATNQEKIILLQDTESEGKISILLVIDGEDQKELPRQMKRAKCLKLSGDKLNSFDKKIWEFNRKGGDMATVTSKLYILKNQELIFKAGLVITDSLIGLQHKDFGWLEPSYNDELMEAILNSDPIHSPVIII